MKLSGLMAGCAVLLMLGACATTPPPEDHALIQARDAVAKLEADPLAQQQAGKPLQEARDSLRQAESSAQAQNLAEADHFAYIAKRKADQGEAMTDESRALQRIAQAEEQRQAVVVANREHETQAARGQAAASEAQAAAAQAEARDAEARAAAAKQRLREMQSQ
jgi:uncharacterized protein DUF4398